MSGAKDAGIERLRKIAEGARANAYAPYSGFHVGAAVETADGRVFAGCNMESSSYGLTNCAERVAIGAAIAAGARELSRIVIVSDAPEPASPCGACRQVAAEFARELRVVSFGTNGARAEWSMEALLPDAFLMDGRDLERPHGTTG